jgi:hypothetical protein
MRFYFVVRIFVPTFDAIYTNYLIQIIMNKEKFTPERVEEERLQSVVRSALADAGLLSDLVTKTKACDLLSRSLVEAGIRSGDLRVTAKRGKNSKQYIALSDVNAYKKKLLNQKISMK